MDKIEIVVDTIVSEVKFKEIHLFAEELIKIDERLATALYQELTMLLYGIGD